MLLPRKPPAHLPFATGPYIPGMTDVMLDYSRNGIFFRIYYPTAAKPPNEQHYKKWFPWVPDESYTAGIAYVLMVFTLIFKIVVWWCGNVHIPALNREKIKNDTKLKCVILSHGLGGNRFLYSNICCEMASQGFVVFALEHRDRSASNTYYYQTEEDAELDKRTPIYFRRINLDNIHFQRRSKQVHRRAEECSKTLDFILNLNKGIVPDNILDRVGDYKKSENNFFLGDFVGLLDVNDITMMGHSFGGGTALLTLSWRKELKQGVLLDPWMYVIKGEHVEEKVDQPLIFINTQTFHVSANVDAMSKYLTNDDSRTMYTILRTTHEYQSDSVLLSGSWLNWFMIKIDPEMALKINNCLIFRFLNKTINYPKDIENHERYLDAKKLYYDIGLTKPWV